MNDGYFDEIGDRLDEYFESLNDQQREQFAGLLADAVVQIINIHSQMLSAGDTHNNAFH